MDPDASPLVQADYYSNQGEQLSCRRAFQQAITAHNEAAKQYQIAAQATTDTGAAKALLLQRDRQVKLATDVQRRLTSGPKAAPPQTKNVSRQGGPASSNGRQMHSGEQPKRNSIQPQPGRSAGGYVPKDRVDASAMAESRYSRNSGGSPSASHITAGTTPGSGESARTSSVEESYYLLRSDSDPSDPVNNFLELVNNMVEELGNAVAFTSIPLETPQIPVSLPTSPRKADRPVSTVPVVRPGAQDSFYIVPQSGAAGRAAQANPTAQGGRGSPGSSKTQEELLAENATLKETLDTLSKQLEWLQKERQRERDKMRGSVALLARDFRKQAERVMGQSVANLGESRRQMPPTPLSALPSLPGHGVGDESARIAALQEELRQARADAERNAQLGQRYKSKYEDLRKQILDKRKAKEAAATQNGGSAEAAIATPRTPQPQAATSKEAG